MPPARERAGQGFLDEPVEECLRFLRLRSYPDLSWLNINHEIVHEIYITRFTHIGFQSIDAWSEPAWIALVVNRRSIGWSFKHSLGLLKVPGKQTESRHLPIGSNEENASFFRKTRHSMTLRQRIPGVDLSIVRTGARPSSPRSERVNSTRPNYCSACWMDERAYMLHS